MSIPRLITFTLIMMTFSQHALAQRDSTLKTKQEIFSGNTTKTTTTLLYNGLLPDLPEDPGSAIFQASDSGIYIYQNIRNGCKNFFTQFYFIPDQALPVKIITVQNALPLPAQKWLTVHGNVTYNFNYRSYVDTPFAEHDLMQHSVQTQLNVKIKDRYPFAVYLNSRRSNSPFFSNATDISVQFKQAAMLEDIKSNLRNDADQLLRNQLLQLTPAQLYDREKQGLLPDIGSFSTKQLKATAEDMAPDKLKASEAEFKKLYADYKSKIDSCKQLFDWANSFARIQELVEEQEKQLRGKGERNLDSLNGTIDGKTAGVDITKLGAVQQKLEDRKKELTVLQKKAAAAEQKLKRFQKTTTDSLQTIKKAIAGITDKNSLQEFLQQKGGSLKQLTGLQRTLLSVRQIGIGRSWIDYSELTVKNISLSGINIEANPGNIYVAAAAGKVNYRFRDYIIKGNYAGSGQSVGLVRAGFGNKNRNNIIVTWYAGKKALLNQRTIADSSALQQITGVSVESSVALDAHNFLTAEYARSSSPGIAGKVLNFKSSTNEAWSLKASSDYGSTRVNAYYRRTGEGFQSFTLYPSNNKQDAWMVRVKQSLWKKRLLLDAAVRKNDFESPVAAPDFSNSNVFKSFQLTVRIPKYPFLSVGYFPSSQLTLSNNNVLYENRYNTLNAIISHSYAAGGFNMNSNATYTRFYNKGNDSGFIYYNASTVTFNHSINLRSFILQGVVTLTDQSQLHQLALEPVVTYILQNKLSFTGSVKWSRVNHIETLWGGTAALSYHIKNIGALQMQYDKIFLPGYNRNLLPVDMGRLTFSRQF